MLCAKCRELGEYPAALWQPAFLESHGSKAGIRIEHCERAQALQQSASNGCHLCSLAWASLAEWRLDSEESVLLQPGTIGFFIWRDQSINVLTSDQRDEYRIDIQCGEYDTRVSGELRCTPMGK